jgi:hypothetical protein
MSSLPPFLQKPDSCSLYAAISEDVLALFMATTEAIMVIALRYAWVLSFLMPRTLSCNCQVKMNKK